MAETKIEWTERTWNPIVGCSLESPGCKHCYAMKMAGRLEAMGLPAYQGTTQKTAKGFVWTGKIGVNDHAMLEPLRRKTPTTWFVNSMSDLFHPDVPDEIIDQIFAVAMLCSRHTFQMLTKRSERMRHWMQRLEAAVIAWFVRGDPELLNDSFPHCAGSIAHPAGPRDWPLPNIWLGVSIEDQKRADERLPDLLATPAAVRWLSCEPLLEEVLFDPCDLARVDWVVVGGESGPGARPMHPEWARSLRDQCAIAAGVPFFFKQWGNWSSIYDRDNDDPDWRRVPKPGDWDKKRWLNRAGGQGFHGDNLHMLQNVGKKAAGRLLDGIIHDERPANG
ncbi:phage Gp37/Gp68 family protein [Sphingobium xenophagum]|uniref:phage Gp37/Gp68 family protein n=1 Tax=Sphingobium xenophagum TaxID=121428 RepID=UPI0003824857|nr:phage Gp37/Gp68 family protein [Sphingobium xenophagum]